MNVLPPAIRWTIGDVSDRGFAELRLSIWGAHRLFGPDARYIVCVNSIPVQAVKDRAGNLPPGVLWHENTGEIPPFIADRLDGSVTEGTAWKFAPLRLFPDRYEIALDNDCILWAMPKAMEEWLAAGDPDQCLMAEDVQACFGQFARLCPSEPINSGIRGLPPGFDLERALQRVLDRLPVKLQSETDEQGLQAAALSIAGPLTLVSLQDVTICSPFHPHLAYLGRCGAHFVGSNARHIRWNYYDRPADQWMAEHWQQNREEVIRRVGIPVGVPGVPIGGSSVAPVAGASEENTAGAAEIPAVIPEANVCAPC